MIIGLVGQKGGGKGTFTDLLKKAAPNKTISRIKSSDILLETLHTWGIPATRRNFQILASTMVADYGEGILTKAVHKRIAHDPSDIVIFDGVRWDSDVKMVREFPQSLIVYVTASPKIRYERTKTRKEKADEGDVTFEQFLEEEQMPTEIDIPRIGAKADFKIINDGTLEDFEKQVKEFYEKLFKRDF